MVEKFRNPLRAAYSGYIYQDLLIAYIFTKGLIHRYSSITVDRKQVEDDRIDDVEIVYAGKRVKRQIKSSEDEERYISVKDFTDKESSLRIDRLVKTYVQAGDSAADEYRLCTTWKISLSNDNFSEFVEPIQLEPTVTGSQSQTFRLLTEKIWPLKERPMWKYLENEVTRDQFLLFCERFAIEVNLPPASRTLHSPGILEGFLVDMMSKNVGIGKYPNQGRQAVDVAALLLSQATSARAEGETLTPQDIETRLNLRTDYGRIAQAFPLDESVFQNRKDLRPILSENALKGMHQILIGMPGAGKSWELTKLANELENSGVLVARHYCYLEPGDDLVERRITSEVLFGNLMADLADAEPSLADSPLRRYSAGAEEFQAFLVKISEMHRKAVVIVDGLDHIARVLKQANSLTSEETDIIGELATLQIPSGISFIIGSQPGHHLDPLRKNLGMQLSELQIKPWDKNDIGQLIRKHGVESIYLKSGGKDFSTVEDLLYQRSEGNPLCTTYLSRQFSSVVESGAIVDYEEWLCSIPAINGDISKYYEYLYCHASDTAKAIADVLGVIDFSVTEVELYGILPTINHRFIPQALIDLFPILTTISSQGGIRIFHESFRRFMMEQIVKDGGGLSNTLEPVIGWLQTKGFYKDARSYRFLLSALYRAGRSKEALGLVNFSFVSESVSYGHPFEAVERNLALVANIAAREMNWSQLVRCSELSRSAYTCYEEKLNDPLSYWETFVELFGAEALVERLLFDGKTTQKADLGLVLCSMADDLGVPPPWKEYIEQYERLELKQRDKEVVGSQLWQQKVSLAKVHCRIKLDGYEKIKSSILNFILTKGKDVSSSYMRALIFRIDKSVGQEAVESIISEGSNPSLNDASLTPRVIALLRMGIVDALAAEGDLEGASRIAAHVINETESLFIAADCLRFDVSYNSQKARERFPAELTFGLDKHHIDDSMASQLHVWVATLRLLSEKSPELLVAELSRLKGEGWYICWLRFVVTTALFESAQKRNDISITIQSVFTELTRDVRPFKGQPRSCDLYNIHGLIRETIDWVISLLRTSEEWRIALNHIKIVLDGVYTSLDRSPMGPIREEFLFEILLPYVRRPEIASIICDFAISIMEDETGTYFEYHAERNMLFARILMASGNAIEAQNRWQRVGIYLCSYGQRKDSTIYEIIDSIPALLGSGKDETFRALIASQPLAEVLLRHTDGRGTKRAQLSWFCSFLKADTSVALMVLFNSISDDWLGWPHEEALFDALKAAKNADPIVLDGLYATLRLSVDLDSHECQKVIEERFPVIEKNIKAGENNPGILNKLAAEVWDDVQTDVSSKEFVISFLETNRIKLASVLKQPTKEVQLGDKNASFMRKNVRRETVPYFKVDSSFVDLVFSTRTAVASWDWEISDRDRFINAFGYRLLGLLKEAKTDEVVQLIKLFARTYSHRDGKIHALADVAEGLERFGYDEVAALAYTLAYVRTHGGGGWLSMGDSKHESALLRAINLKRDKSLQIFALEIAYILRNISYHGGISSNLIERIAAWKEPETAKECWWAAFEVIKHRLPFDIGVNGWFERFVPDSIARDYSVNEALVSVLLARVNHPILHYKISALAEIARIIALRPNFLSRPLHAFFMRNQPLSSQLLIMDVLMEFEKEPYSISKVAEDILQDSAGSDFWGVRMLARNLLERIGSSVKTNFISKEYKKGSPPLEKVEGILSIDQGDRIKVIESVWPGISEIVASRFDSLFDDSKEQHQEKCRETYKLAYGRDGDVRPATPVLGWEKELFEVALHEILNSLNEVLWKNGTWSRTKEESVLKGILPCLAVHFGMAASRVVRPSYAAPITAQEGRAEIKTIEDDSEYKSWIRVGYFEQQWTREHTKKYGPPTERTTVFSGIYADALGAEPDFEVFPFHQATDINHLWEVPNSFVFRYMFPLGPPICLNRFTDWMGDAFILMPPIEMRACLEISAPNFGEPLRWKNKNGEEVAVLRTWQVRDRSQYSAEPLEYNGSDLLMRPDVYFQLENLIGVELKEQTVIMKSKV